MNWQRLHKFCVRENLNYQEIKLATADALQKFLANEVADVQSSGRGSSVNCSSGELESLVVSLGLSEEDLPKGWQEVCPAG